MDNEGWTAFLNQVVVIDTNSQFVYLGTLARIDDHFVALRDVDVHDRQEGPSTKDQYVIDAKRFGVRPNRKEASVRKGLIVSLSRLDDVVIY